MNTLMRMFSLCLCMSLFAFSSASTNHDETRDLRDLGWQSAEKVGKVIKGEARSLANINSTQENIRSLAETNTDSQQNRDCTDCEFDFTNYGSECCDSAWDEFGINCQDLEANYSWDCSGCACPGDGEAVCGDGYCSGEETYENCPEDCNAPGECDDGYIIDCVDDDCCPESWIGDGFEDCEDQAYGCDLTCYDNDGGDCDGSTTDTTGGTTGGTADCEDCEFDFTNYGSECCDTAWVEFGINCADLEANYSWDCAGCNCLGDGDPECGDGSCNGDETYETCPEDCNAPGECDDGYIIDCVDDDCCPESWIGDGFEDCEDQAYGCDLTCYDNDGGDCDGTRSSSQGYKSMTQSLRSGHRVVGEMHAAKQEATALKDGVITNSDNAVRMGAPIFGNESREIASFLEYTVLEGLNAGFSQIWENDPSFGEFTVYGFDVSDLVIATVTFCDGNACSETVGNTEFPVYAGSEDEWCGEAGCENGMGDVNNDGTVNVLDIVNIVNHILGGSELVDCNLEAADYNSDGTVNVLDIVNIVNAILGGKSADATSATLDKTASALSISADGYVGGVQMTLSHGADFAIDVTDNALVADYRTDGNQTILVIVAPEGGELFTYSGDFEIVDMIVANSHSEISVGQPTVFALSAAYPNPFNPTTSLSLNLPESGYVSVKIYNMMGQEIATLADGLMDASAYTLTWDASDASSGMYFVRAEYAGSIATQKLMLLK